ncbi:MAG TPA: MFS transporter [Syntrophorhabdaceae bacterium]|nr:MFS transporter [Syntrophorhabdaceae bacterium]
MVLYFTQRWIFGPLIPSLMEAFGADRTALGIVGAGSLWGYMFTPIIAGMLSDRFGRRYTVLFGIFGFSLLTVVSGMANSTGQLFLFRLVTGMTEAFFFIPLIAFTMELFPERPGFYVTFMSSGTSMGWFTGPALAGWLLDLTGNWRVPFILTGLAGIGIALLLMFFWPEEKKEIHTGGSFFDRSIMQRSSITMLVLVSFASMFQISAEFGFAMWYPVFLKTEIGTSASVAGVIAGVWGVGQFIGRPTMGWASDRLGYRRVGVIGGIVMGLSLILVLRAENPFLRGFLTLFTGFVGSAVMGTLWTFTGLTFSRARGLALGIMTTFSYAVSSLSPITIGYIGDRCRVSTGLMAICVPAVFLACAIFASTNFIKKDNQR